MGSVWQPGGRKHSVVWIQQGEQAVAVLGVVLQYPLQCSHLISPDYVMLINEMPVISR